MTSPLSRRDFIQRGSLALAAVGLGRLALRADAAPTESSGDLGSYGSYLQEKPKPTGKPRTDFAPTEDNILGPFHRPGAPFRGKITPPLEAGTALLIRGCVWAHDTRKPISGTTLDIWQANAHGRYDNGDRNNPPPNGVFQYRARLLTDEQGYYEYETIHPGRYKIAPSVWRPSHIHYWVRGAGYKELVTQLYFAGDPMNETDEFIKESLIIDLRPRKSATGATYEEGTFDIVLARIGS